MPLHASTFGLSRWLGSWCACFMRRGKMNGICTAGGTRGDSCPLLVVPGLGLAPAPGLEKMSAPSIRSSPNHSVHPNILLTDGREPGREPEPGYKQQRTTDNYSIDASGAAALCPIQIVLT